MQGHIVIGLAGFAHADQPAGARFLLSDGDETRAEKRAIDELHLRKIDLADEIFVVNVGGYVGASTHREIQYAQSRGLPVRWMFSEELQPVAAAGVLAASLKRQSD